MAFISYTVTHGKALDLEMHLQKDPMADEPTWLTLARLNLSDALDEYVKATNRYMSGAREDVPTENHADPTETSE